MMLSEWYQQWVLASPRKRKNMRRRVLLNTVALLAYASIAGLFLGLFIQFMIDLL